MKNIQLLLFLFLTTILLNAQRKADPTAVEISLAKTLKKQFPDDDLAFKSHDETITFGFSGKTNQVTVQQTISKDIINLNSRSDIQEYTFYDGESEIEDFKISYRNKKTPTLILRMKPTLATTCFIMIQG